MPSEIKLTTAVRDDMLDLIVAAIGSNGLIDIYTGPKPAGPATAITTQTKLATLALSATAGVVSSGVLTFNTISDDIDVDADGTAAWYRAKTSGGAGVVDGTVGTSNADLVLNTVNFVENGVVGITSLTLTAPG